MHKILPVFIPFSGCENRCVYCDQHAVSGIGEGELLVSCREQILTGIEHHPNATQIAYYGGSFTFLRADEREQLYRLAKEFGFEHIRISTRPDSFTDEIAEELEENCVKTIEFGIQTLEENALRKSGRPYSREEALSTIERACTRFDVVAQVMPGLPDSSPDSFLEDVKLITGYPVTAARIYPTVVFRDTELEKMMQRGEYTPLTLVESVELAARTFVLFASAQIPVIRMGLPLEGGCGYAIAAGGIHPAFGDMVKTTLLLAHAATGGKIVTGSRYRSAGAGYGGVVAKLYPDAIVDSDSATVPEWSEIAEAIQRRSDESSERFSEGVIAEAARKVVACTSHH